MRIRGGEAHSHPLHKTIHHAFLAGLVEGDGELVAVDADDVAVAEFLVEHAVADREGGDGAGGFGDQLAFDGERAAAAGGVAGVEPNAPPPSLALPRKGGGDPPRCWAAACA